MRIEIASLTKMYGPVAAIDDLSLEIADGELIVLLGPSGCGKTTTMRSVVGLERPTVGRIEVGGVTVFDEAARIDVPPNRRNMGMVFQSYAIWPHKTVAENVAFPLQQQKVGASEIRGRVERVLDLVGLTGFGDRGASLLSGGQMQRVALARSVIAEPRVLLLDEPLSNLDAKLRDHLRFELREIQQRLGITAIYVTHDQQEALALADRIAVMQHGRIVQLGTPQQLYTNPANRFVADFLGVGNLFEVEVEEIEPNGTIVTRLGKTQVRVQQEGFTLSTRKAVLCLRPERVGLASAGAAPPEWVDAATLDAEVVVASYLGSHVRYLLKLDSGHEMQAVSYDVDNVRRPGGKVGVLISPRHAQILPREETGEPIE